jgi:hypothetical protein
MFTVKVTLPNLSRIARRLPSAIREASVDGLRDADTAVGNMAGQQINSQGGRLGTTWKELSAFTQKRRRKRYPSTYYGKHASGSGPARPIGVWTGLLRSVVFRPGSVNARKLTARREYQGGANASSVATQRLFFLHAGGVRSDEDGVRIQPPRKVFHMGDGTPMPRVAFRAFHRKFGVSLLAAMGRP